MIIKKWRFFLFYTNEEKWLNDMAQKGLHFINYKFGRYYFEQGEPGKYEYRLELLNAYPSSVVGKNYISFLEEFGVECVDTSFRWGYFRRLTTDEPFEIYTDPTSKKKHLNRIIMSLGFFTLLNLFIVVDNILSKNTFVFTGFLSIFHFICVLLFLFILIKYIKMKRNINEKNTGQDIF